MAEPDFDFESIGEVGTSTLDLTAGGDAGGFDFENIGQPEDFSAAAPRQAGAGAELPDFIANNVSDDVKFILSQATEDITSGNALLRGLDVLFSPITGTAAAAKAQILGQDPKQAFQNRILQATDLDQFIKSESGGKLDPTMTPEDIVQGQIERGEVRSEDALSTPKIFALGLIEGLEIAAPTPALKLGKLGIIGEKLGRGVKFTSKKLAPLVKKARNLSETAFVKSLKLGHPLEEVGLIRRTFRTTGANLKRLGESGTKLGNMIDIVRHKAEGKAGAVLVDVEDNLVGLSAKEKESFVRVLDEGGIPLNDKVARAAANERLRLNAVHDEAVEVFKRDIQKENPGVTSDELDNLVEVLKFRAAPISPRVEQLAATAEDSIPAFRENFFPHIFDMSDLSQSEKKVKIINQMVAKRLHKAGAFSTRKEALDATRGSAAKTQFADEFAAAEAQLNKAAGDLTGRRFGNLELSRLDGAEGWIKSPEEALSIYYRRAIQRIEEVKTYGANDQIAERVITKIGDDGLDEAFAQRAFERAVGKNKFSESTNRVVDAITGAQVVSKLGLAQISNAPQGLVNTALNSNVKIAAKAFQQSFTGEGKRFARRSGATLASHMDDLARVGREGGVKEGFASTFLRKTFFTAAETKNRIVASLGGKLQAEWAADQLRKFGTQTGRRARFKTERAREVLEELGLDVDDVARRAAADHIDDVSGGILTKDELLQSGLRFSNTTQFRSGVLERPEFFDHPLGRVLFQFKTFASNHAKFLMKSIGNRTIKAAARGDVDALAEILTKIGFASIVGEVPKDIKLLLKGENPLEREADIGRLVENFAAIGGLGIISDTANAFQFGESGLRSLALGPTVSDILRTTKAVGTPVFTDFDVLGSAAAVPSEAVRLLPFERQLGQLTFGQPLSREIRDALK